MLCVCAIEYAQVVKMLGNGRLEAYCFDGANRLCHIRGKLRKKVATSSFCVLLLSQYHLEDVMHVWGNWQEVDTNINYDIV